VLSERATGNILVFSDTNVILDLEALRRLGARFASEQVGCVAGNLIYVNPTETTAAKTSYIYWQYEEFIKQLEADLFNVIGVDGSLFAVRRSVHKPVPPDLIDDFYLSMRILLDGYRVTREPTAIAYERSATDGGEEFRRKIRIACQAFNIHRLIWREMLGYPMALYCYTSHRLLKWLIIYDLIATVLIATALLYLTLPAILVTSVIGGSIALFAVLWGIGFEPARQLVSILMAFVGVGIGIWRSLRGERFTTWQPTASAR
jgi:cellulose synthase/poly-beta-1,6-N-acetylglucosamine synthase-like glycosyltransferase